MRFQKTMLSLLMMGVSTIALAKEDWQRIEFNNKTVNLYFDKNSIKPRTDEYNNRYLEARFSQIYQEPKKLSNGKFYTEFYQTLSVDCSHEAYATYNWNWQINSKSVHRGEGKKDEWNKYDDEKNSTATQARALCRYYKSFLG